MCIRLYCTKFCLSIHRSIGVYITLSADRIITTFSSVIPSRNFWWIWIWSELFMNSVGEAGFMNTPPNPPNTVNEYEWICEYSWMCIHQTAGRGKPWNPSQNVLLLAKFYTFKTFPKKGRHLGSRLIPCTYICRLHIYVHGQVHVHELVNERWMNVNSWGRDSRSRGVGEYERECEPEPPDSFIFIHRFMNK